MKKIFVLCLLVLAPSVFMCTAGFGENKDQPGVQREAYFKCVGESIYEPSNAVGPAEAVLTVNSKTISVTGAWPFPQNEIQITSETKVEIEFSKMIGTTVFGSTGIFNKVTGKLHIVDTDGLGTEPQKWRLRWTGDYECKPTKKML